MGIVKKLILIALAALSIALPNQLLSFEPYRPIVSTSSWVSSCALETLSLLSPDVRHMLYGNNPVNESTKKVFNDILSSLNLDTPTDINESRSLWPMIAGNVFNNYDSLFVSKNTLEQIQSGTPLSEQTKKDLVSAVLMIKNGCDAKVLAAFIVTPIAVWASIHYLNELLEKIKASESEKPWVKKMTSTVAAVKESFQTKELIALSLTGVFILYQYYTMRNQAARLLL